jgi:hypothetical protein
MNYSFKYRIDVISGNQAPGQHKEQANVPGKRVSYLFIPTLRAGTMALVPAYIPCCKMECTKCSLEPWTRLVRAT